MELRKKEIEERRLKRGERRENTYIKNEGYSGIEDGEYSRIKNERCSEIKDGEYSGIKNEGYSGIEAGDWRLENTGIKDCDKGISQSSILNPQSSRPFSLLSPLSPLLSTISTIYLGGGTPSLLSAANLHKLFIYINKVYGTDFHSAEDGSPMEITMECNPDDITPEFCRTLRTLPVNRISMGAQTFSDERLRFLHRRHTAEEVRTAVKRLRAIGIENISIDLMFGFPGETLKEWESDISECLALDVEHISAYSLMYEEGTLLHKMLVEHKISEIDDELSLQMYNTLIDRLTAAGFEHYEISNFAKKWTSGQADKQTSGQVNTFNSYSQSSILNSQSSILNPQFSILNSQSSENPQSLKPSPIPNSPSHSLSPIPYPLSSLEYSFRSRHNSSYWHGIPYIGLGAAAHSYDILSRRWNVSDIKKYIESIERGKLPYESEVLDTNTRYNDAVMTSLRTKEGIDLNYIASAFGARYREYLLHNAQKNIALGNLVIEGDRLRLSRKGIYISDGITAGLFI